MQVERTYLAQGELGQVLVRPVGLAHGHFGNVDLLAAVLSSDQSLVRPQVVGKSIQNLSKRFVTLDQLVLDQSLRELQTSRQR